MTSETSRTQQHLTVDFPRLSWNRHRRFLTSFFLGYHGDLCVQIFFDQARRGRPTLFLRGATLHPPLTGGERDRDRGRERDGGWVGGGEREREREGGGGGDLQVWDFAGHQQSCSHTTPCRHGYNQLEGSAVYSLCGTCREGVQQSSVKKKKND